MHVIVVACAVILVGFFVSTICLLRPAKVYKAPERKTLDQGMAQLAKADAKSIAAVAPAPQKEFKNSVLTDHGFDKEGFLTKLAKFKKRHWTHLNNVYSVTDEADAWGTYILPIVPNWLTRTNALENHLGLSPAQCGTQLGKDLAAIWKAEGKNMVATPLVISAHALLSERAFTLLGVEMPLTFYDDLPGEKTRHDVYNGIADFIALDADGKVCIIETKYTTTASGMGDRCAFRKSWIYQVLYYQLALKQMAELDYLPKAYILQLRESGAVTLSVVDHHGCDYNRRAQTKITIGKDIYWFADKFVSLSLTMGEHPYEEDSSVRQVRPVGGLLSARTSIKPTDSIDNLFVEFNRQTFCFLSPNESKERITVYVDLDEAPLVWTPSQNRVGERYDVILTEARAALLAYKNPERVSFDILWRKNPREPSEGVHQTRQILDWFDRQSVKTLTALKKAPDYPGEVLQQIKNNPRLIDVGNVVVLPGNPGVVGGGIAQDGTSLQGVAARRIAQEPRAREVGRVVQTVDIQAASSSSHGLGP